MKSKFLYPLPVAFAMAAFLLVAGAGFISGEVCRQDSS